MIVPADTQTNAPETEYFFLGDGRIMVPVQWSRNPQLSPYGLLLTDPERVSRKQGALLFHPEHGLKKTMLTLYIDGKRYSPAHDTTRVAWDIQTNPAVVITWNAGPCEISERLYVQQTTSNLVREVRVSNAEGCRVSIEAALYANPLFFDEFGSYPGNTLYAAGYQTITLYSTPTGKSFERFLTVESDPGADTSGVVATFVYSLLAMGTHEFSLYPTGFELEELQLEATASGHTAPSPADHTTMGGGNNVGSEAFVLGTRIKALYDISRTSLRASVSHLGKFDASIWQYDFEWGMDAAMVAIAATCSGNFTLARQVLTNILERLSDETGAIMEASRFRYGPLSELNGNGAVLDALWHYWRWSGDTEFLIPHWTRITAIAEYPLRPEFEHESGLLKTERDFWERTPWQGVREGFELGHQVFCVVGLRSAAEMAEFLGHSDSAQRWSAAAERINSSLLKDPPFSLLDFGAFIKRRLLDGSVQGEMRGGDGEYPKEYQPYLPAEFSEETPRPCEPDITEILPIVYGLVDSHGDVARATLEKIRALWNPTGEGGYARYNIGSEPDSPGPWPFATAFVAAAEIDAGMEGRAYETINWLLEKAGRGGSWFEYYGVRPEANLPPIGIIVWGWAQWILLVTKHLAGVRVRGNSVRISPKMIGLSHTARFGNHTIGITVTGFSRALLDGNECALEEQTAVLELPLQKNHLLEFLA